MENRIEPKSRVILGLEGKTLMRTNSETESIQYRRLRKHKECRELVGFDLKRLQVQTDDLYVREFFYISVTVDLLDSN